MITSSIDTNIINEFSQKLEEHPIYSSLSSLNDLRCFMRHHVYSVWDFMSLIKSLQHTIAPSEFPWVPPSARVHSCSTDVKRFINELVLEEESDQDFPKNQEDLENPTRFISHFELYHHAMKEVGSDTSVSQNFVETVSRKGFQHALETCDIPQPSKVFTQTTFRFLDTKKPHVVGAALALGREHIIPFMFRKILSETQVSEEQAPMFHYYVNRHIHLDSDFHGPMSLKLLEQLCHGDEKKINETYEAAEEAVQARLTFWDGVLEAIQ